MSKSSSCNRERGNQALTAGMSSRLSGATCRVRWTYLRSTVSTYTKPPGALTFFPIGEVPPIRLRSRSELTSCAVNDELVESIRLEVDGYRSHELLHRSGFRDDAAERIVALLAIEMESGGLSGSLYAESLIRALVCRYIVLASEGAQRTLPAVGAMHPRLLKRHREWMEENAHRDISLSAMAKETKYKAATLGHKVSCRRLVTNG